MLQYLLYSAMLNCRDLIISKNSFYCKILKNVYRYTVHSLAPWVLCCMLHFECFVTVVRILPVILFHACTTRDFAGPKRSTLQAMLANLSDGEDLSSSPAGAASSSVNQNSMGNVDDMGMHGAWLATQLVLIIQTVNWDWDCTS